MIRTPTLVFWATLLLATNTAQAAKVSLARGETSDEAHLPYRQANLRIQYDPSDGGGEVIRCVTIRSSRGGPTMLFDVTIPPRAPAQSIDVLIPAMSTEDSCNVRLLSGKTADSPTIAEFDLTIDWPTTSVTAQTFLDPDAYDQGDFLPPVWSDRTLQTVFVTALAACILLSACLLIKRGAWRITTAGATLIAAAAGLWLVAGAEPTVIRKELGDDGRLMLVSCLRDATVEIESPHIIPIYYNMDEMSSDRALVATSGKLLVDLKAGQVRLFAQQRTEKTKPRQASEGNSSSGSESSGGSSNRLPASSQTLSSGVGATLGGDWNRFEIHRVHRIAMKPSVTSRSPVIRYIMRIR